ncbi:hypothetical protein DVW06_11095 [Enterococcus sp. ARL09-542]|uniref:hypothetical protein n=1 Tax=Enterococcus sp. ARL09-542 TaxID=2233534 RepID=UPI0010C1D93C|nr:hypothetical protein [Enterococcus sp. ARL09-542]TKL05305.1 hypothetical protein DVW06_11095 [Enterococcus sp. ARL09-542]
MNEEYEELLNMGMGILKSADASKLESVNVNATKRSDGSKIIAIELVYPEEVDSKDYHIHTGKITGKTITRPLSDIMKDSQDQRGRILGY